MKSLFNKLKFTFLFSLLNFSVGFAQTPCPDTASIMVTNECIEWVGMSGGYIKTAVSDSIYLWDSKHNRYEIVSIQGNCKVDTRVTNFTYTNGTMTCTYANGILPVAFSGFESKVNGEKVDLTFSTSSETNNDYFTIERSGDATHFMSIAVIDGAGNSSEKLYYSYTDVSPLNGFNYYRIRQTDFDGKSTYSDVRSASVVSTMRTQLNTFIFNGLLIINSTEESYNVTIYNSSGFEVKSYPGRYMSNTIDVQDLASGLYFVSISAANKSETVRVVKLQ